MSIATRITHQAAVFHGQKHDNPHNHQVNWGVLGWILLATILGVLAFSIFITTKDIIARWLLKLLGTTPEQDFIDKTLAKVEMELRVNGNLSVVDENGNLK